MLSDELTIQGERLFRGRSYLPLVLLPLVAAALLDFHYPFGSHLLDVVREFACLAIAAMGAAMRAGTVGFVPRGTSGRGTKQMEAEVLNTSGLYSIVRHPVYVANYIIFVAFTLNTGHWWLVLTGSLAYWVYYERIMAAEEAFLLAKHGPKLKQWADQTPAVLPRLRNWKRPSLPFSWVSVLRREYTTWFIIIIVFTATEFVGDLVVEKRVVVEPLWAGIFLTGLAFYLACRTAKKMNWLPATDR